MIKTYSIMPHSVRYNEKVSAQAKILWLEISAYNYANIYEIRNSTLAKDLSLSEVQISRLINQLKKKNLMLVYKSPLNIRRLCAIGYSEEEKNAAQSQKTSEKDKKKHEMPKVLRDFLNN